MKALYKILIVLGLALGVASCVQEQIKSEPAPIEEGVWFYFPTSSANPSFTVKEIKDAVDTLDTVTVKIARFDTSAAATAVLEVTGDTQNFYKISTEIDFEKGQKESVVEFIYAKSFTLPAEEVKTAVVNVKITNETTESALSDCNVTFKVPSLQKWARIATEPMLQDGYLLDYFGIENIFDAYVEKLEGHEVYRVVNPYWAYQYGPGEKDYWENPEMGWYDKVSSFVYYYGNLTMPWTADQVTEVVNSIVLDLEGFYVTEDMLAAAGIDKWPTNAVYVPLFDTGVSYNGNPSTQYISIFGINPGKYNPSTGYNFGKYDPAKKTITFGDLVFTDISTGEGWYGGIELPFKLYLDKTLMWSNYNGTLFEFPTVVDEDLVLTSELFTTDPESPAEFTGITILQNDQDSTLFYIPDYFGENYGLAFRSQVSAQTITVEGKDSVVYRPFDGALISNVDNYQETGLYQFGKDLLVNVKRGSFSLDEKGNLAATIVLNIYAEYKNADDEDATLDFGEFEESIYHVYYAPKYTASDIAGLTIATYEAYKWLAYGQYYENNNWAEEKPFTYVYYDYAGQAEDGSYYITVSGLSGYPSAYWKDETEDLTVEWYNGFLYFYSQKLNPMAYEGGEYSAIFNVGDSETFKFGAGSGEVHYSLGGYVKADGCVALVEYPHNTAGHGDAINFYCPNLGVYDVYKFVWMKPAAQRASAAPALKSFNAQIAREINPANAISSSRSNNLVQPEKKLNLSAGEVSKKEAVKAETSMEPKAVNAVRR